MKTHTNADESGRTTTLERWQKVLAACSLSLILACTSPVGPEALDENALRSGDEEPDVESPALRHERDDDEWRRGGSGDLDDWRKWLW